MAGELAHDVHDVVSEPEGRRFRRTAEPRPTCRGNERLRVHAYNYIGTLGMPGRVLGKAGVDYC